MTEDLAPCGAETCSSCFTGADPRAQPPRDYLHAAKEVFDEGAMALADAVESFREDLSDERTSLEQVQVLAQLATACFSMVQAAVDIHNSNDLGNMTKQFDKGLDVQAFVAQMMAKMAGVPVPIDQDPPRDPEVPG